MIVRMVKYTLVVMAGEREEFLARLQELGLVDVTANSWEPSAAERETMASIDKYTKAADFLRGVAELGESYSTGEEALAAYEGARSGLAEAQAERARLEKLLADLEPLGNFDPVRIREIEGHGVDVFALAGVERMELPEKGPEAMRGDLESLQITIAEHNKTLSRTAASIPLMERECTRLKDELHLQKVARNGGTEAVDGQMVVMEAWAREKQAAQVEALLDAHPGTLFLKSRPTPDDEVPVELHNARLTRPFEFIAEMYALPRYGTMDLTRWFAPFYTLFFAFCLADAGYGLLILLGGIFVAMRGSGAMKSIGTLSVWCGGASVVFGFLAGSFFGINIKEWFGGANLFFPDDDMFLFSLALGLGVLQILFGMVLKAITTIRFFGVRYALATIGWIVVLVAAIAMMVPELMGIEKPVPAVALYGAMGVGAFMMLFMNNPGKGPLVNFGGGLWNTYNDVTGFLSDALSYIRLFAIGLSGGVLAQVFNDLAFGMSPDIPVLGQIVTLIILLIGHGLNLFMSTLSSMVHPLRLTFVEFYKNAGFEASQRTFEPLKKASK